MVMFYKKLVSYSIFRSISSCSAIAYIFSVTISSSFSSKINSFSFRLLRLRFFFSALRSSSLSKSSKHSRSGDFETCVVSLYCSSIFSLVLSDLFCWTNSLLIRLRMGVMFLSMSRSKRCLSGPAL